MSAEAYRNSPISPRPRKLRAEIERWHLTAPFRITGKTFEYADVLLVGLEQDGVMGRGEAYGVFYKNDDATSMIRQVEALRASLEAGVSRTALQQLLLPGGARNAVDCALWDLESKLAGRPAWQLAGLDAPRPLMTTFGCGADTPENMAAASRADKRARAIKLKLTGEPIDADRVRAVREARPDVWLGIDANQGMTRAFLERLMPVLVEARVSLIEQPLPVGEEALLEDLRSPIPLAADESVQTLEDIPALIGRFNVVNVKLDKCGGLTEALAMARACRQLGLDVMAGSTCGTSLAMAPAFLLGQLCSVVDLDGPILLKTDRLDAVEYEEGLLTCSKLSWGQPKFPG